MMHDARIAREVSEKSLLSEVKRAIDAEIQKSVDAAIEQAVQKIKTEVRKKMGEIAVGLLSDYRIERMGRELVIRIDINGAA